MPNHATKQANTAHLSTMSCLLYDHCFSFMSLLFYVPDKFQEHIMPKSVSTFQTVWLDPDWAPWIRRAPLDTDAYCTFCRKTFSISSIGRSAIISHLKSEKHKSNAPGLSSDQPSLGFFGIDGRNSTATAPTPNTASSSPTIQSRRCASVLKRIALRRQQQRHLYRQLELVLLCLDWIIALYYGSTWYAPR